MIECLPSKSEALGSITKTRKKKIGEALGSHYLSDSAQLMVTKDDFFFLYDSVKEKHIGGGIL